MMASDPDPTARFSTRVADYVRYRPGYPREIVATLANECGLTPVSLIADIGCGPGNLARMFLENGNRVIGVEPNAPMREAAVRELAGSINDLPWNGPNAVLQACWGQDGAAIYGQTFQATADDSTLNSVTFYLSDFGNLQSYSGSFTADVYSWNGSTTTGAALFTSSVETISTDSLALTAGDEYIAYFSSLGQTGSGYAGLEAFDSDVYADGAFEFSDDGSNFYTNGGYENEDLAFDLEFADSGSDLSAPEPATLAMFAGALLALGHRWKRRHCD